MAASVLENSDVRDRGTSLQPTGTVTGVDGTVLVTISRHTEGRGNLGDAALVVVDVVGDIDLSTAPLLQISLARAIERDRQVCCDLSRVQFLGADAVNTILTAVRIADETGCTFTVRGVHGIGARVFQITGLDSVLASRA